MTPTKTFDCVQLMRRLRDQLSEEMAALSPEERTRYIQQKAAASPLLADLTKQSSSLKRAGAGADVAASD